MPNPKFRHGACGAHYRCRHMPTDLTSKSRNHRQPEAFPHIPASWRLCAEYKLLIFSFQQWLETWPAPEKLELLFFFCCSTIVESVLKKSTTLLFVTDFIIAELYPFDFAISKKTSKNVNAFFYLRL